MIHSDKLIQSEKEPRSRFIGRSICLFFLLLSCIGMLDSCIGQPHVYHKFDCPQSVSNRMTRAQAQAYLYRGWNITPDQYDEVMFDV